MSLRIPTVVCALVACTSLALAQAPAAPEAVPATPETPATAAADPPAAPVSMASAAAAAPPAQGEGRTDRSRDYDRYCSACHGEHGNGSGMSARSLSPPPRDFTGAVFKCRTTASGALPTEDDIRHTIVAGIPGTAMPGWSTMSKEQLDDLVGTLKDFSPRWRTEAPPAAIAIPPEPEASASSVARGAEIFAKMQCQACHGPKGHADGPAANSLRDDWGNAIHPADFTRKGAMRCGEGSSRLYTTLMTGINGTPMPSFAAQVSPEEAWDLVHYIVSLRE